MKLSFILVLLYGSLAISAEHIVTLKGWVFTPSEIKIKVGDKVTWMNDDDTIHFVNFDDPRLKSSDVIKPEKTYSLVFKEKGNIPYYCRPHKDHGMRGLIIVE